MKDELVRAMTKDGFVNAVAVTSTAIVERARQIHKTLPTATAALGRLLTAASMMGNMQKTEDASLTLQLKGGGPLGRLLAVSDADGGWHTAANAAGPGKHTLHTQPHKRQARKLPLGACAPVHFLAAASKMLQKAWNARALSGQIETPPFFTISLDAQPRTCRP